MSYR
ncbi:hypothetical protein SLEP1_g60436, partial [Rubroshorea leprosula]|jgi:hypothetical protein